MLRKVERAQLNGQNCWECEKVRILILQCMQK